MKNLISLILMSILVLSFSYAKEVNESKTKQSKVKQSKNATEVKEKTPETKDIFEEQEEFTTEQVEEMSFKELFNKIHEKIEWERFKLDSKKTAIERELEIIKIQKMKLKAQNELIKLKQEFKKLQKQEKAKNEIKKEKVEINKKEAEVKKIETDNKKAEAEIKKIEDEMKLKEQELKMKVTNLLNDKKRLAMELKEREMKLDQEHQSKNLEIKDNKLKVEMKEKIIKQAEKKISNLKSKPYSFKMNESMFDGFYFSGLNKIYAIELGLLDSIVEDKEEKYQSQLEAEELKLSSLTDLGEKKESKAIPQMLAPVEAGTDKEEVKVDEDKNEKIIYIEDGFEYKGYAFKVKNDKNYVCVSKILTDDNSSCFK